MSEEQTTDVVESEETTETEVQPEQTAFEQIADGLMLGESDEVEEVAEVEETQEEEPEKEEPAKYKVKVDGEESEVDLDELIAGYQYNRHNTRKAQTLAEKERELAAMEGLANRLKTDQAFAQHVFQYGQQQEQSKEELDPIEQIKAEARAEALKEVEKKFQEQNQSQVQQTIQRVRDHVAKDPLYDKVQESLVKYVESMPTESLRKQVYQSLDTDPETYVKMYQRVRAAIAPKTEQKTPEKVGKKIDAPVLLNSGNTNDVPVETKNKNNRKKLKADMLRTGDLSNLQEYFLQPGGLADQLA